jgi:FkbM family methyltransferase
LVWDYFGRKKDGFFIEVGANDPTQLSQTWFLEQQGWKGLLVEPLPNCCERLRTQRPRSIVCQTAVGSPPQVGQATFHVAASDAWSRLGPMDDSVQETETLQVSVKTLDTVCAEHNVRQIDFLSIDVEGMELDVLKGFNLQRYQPSLILLEDHMDTIHLYLYMRHSGYRLSKRTGCNNWWIPRGAPPLPQTFREKLSIWNRLLFRKPLGRLRDIFQSPAPR